MNPQVPAQVPGLVVSPMRRRQGERAVGGGWLTGREGSGWATGRGRAVVGRERVGGRLVDGRHRQRGQVGRCEQWAAAIGQWAGRVEPPPCWTRVRRVETGWPPISP